MNPNESDGDSPDVNYPVDGSIDEAHPVDQATSVAVDVSTAKHHTWGESCDACACWTARAASFNQALSDFACPPATALRAR